MLSFPVIGMLVGFVILCLTVYAVKYGFKDPNEGVSLTPWEDEDESVVEDRKMIIDPAAAYRTSADEDVDLFIVNDDPDLNFERHMSIMVDDLNNQLSGKEIFDLNDHTEIRTSLYTDYGKLLLEVEKMFTDGKTKIIDKLYNDYGVAVWSNKNEPNFTYIKIKGVMLVM